MTVATFLDRWLRDSVTPTVRPATLASYSGLVRIHIPPGLGSIRLSQLGPAEVQRFPSRLDGSQRPGMNGGDAAVAINQVRPAGNLTA